AIPEEGPDEPSVPAPQGRWETGRLVLGGSLVVLGLVLLLDRLAPDLDELFWPVAVGTVGGRVILVGRAKGGPGPPRPRRGRAVRAGRGGHRRGRDHPGGAAQVSTGTPPPPGPKPAPGPAAPESAVAT